MSSNLVTKIFKGHRIRFVTLLNKPWFHVADVCRALGLGLSAGTSMHLGKLDADERQTVSATSLNPILGRGEAALVLGAPAVWC